MQSNFIEIAVRHGCSPVNLLNIFRISLEGCFCFLHHEILVCCFYFAHGYFLISLPCLFLSLPLSVLVLFMLQKYFTINLFITCFFIFFFLKSWIYTSLYLLHTLTASLNQTISLVRIFSICSVEITTYFINII